MCLGDISRVVGLVGTDRAIVERTGQRSIVSLAVMRADGIQIATGDLVVVSMGLAIAVTNDAAEAEMASLLDRERTTP